MATTTNFGWETPDDTDLVKDGALAIRTLGNSIDTSLVDLKGGTTGQVLSKTSNTDMDFTWVTSDDANAIQNAIVDAKGDLIAASAADTPARLAVGNNGETLVADSSTSTGLRYTTPVASLANPIINGGFDIWQRGTSIAGANAKTYTADRWTLYRTNTTISRQSVGDTTNLPNIQYCARVQRNATTSGIAANILDYSIETANSIPYAGKAVTLSFYARKGADYSATSSALVSSLFSGTGTDQAVIDGFTGLATVATATHTLTSNWQRFVITGTVGATATELAVEFTFTPVGTAGTNDYYEVTGVQIDLGTYTASSAPTFRRAGGNIAGELAACQRYYWRNSSATGAFPLVSTGYCENATNAYFAVVLPTEMRIAPTSPTYSNLRVYDASALSAVTAVVMTGATAKVANLAVTTTGLTAGRACVLLAGTTGSPYIDFTAEL